MSTSSADCGKKAARQPENAAAGAPAFFTAADGQPAGTRKSEKFTVYLFTRALFFSIMKNDDSSENRERNG